MPTDNSAEHFRKAAAQLAAISLDPEAPDYEKQIAAVQRDFDDAGVQAAWKAQFATAPVPPPAHIATAPPPDLTVLEACQVIGIEPPRVPSHGSVSMKEALALKELWEMSSGGVPAAEGAPKVNPVTGHNIPPAKLGEIQAWARAYARKHPKATTREVTRAVRRHFKIQIV